MIINAGGATIWKSDGSGLMILQLLRAPPSWGDWACNFSRNSYHRGMTTIVSEKGQVTIPKKLRNQLGLAPGTVLDFTAERGALIGRKKVPHDPAAKWLGASKSFLRKLRLSCTDDYLSIIRDGHSG
jgi:AbrB family looped-hinge helix DNA binding protein